MRYRGAACGAGGVHAAQGQCTRYLGQRMRCWASACGAGRVHAVHGGDRRPAYARPQAGRGRGRACSTRVKHSRWCAVGSPMWNVRVTSVVPQSYWPPARAPARWWGARVRTHAAVCKRSVIVSYLHSRLRAALSAALRTRPRARGARPAGARRCRPAAACRRRRPRRRPAARGSG